MAESFARLKESFIFNFIEGARWKYITNGLLVTLKVTFFALLLGIAIGVVVAMIRSSYDQMEDEMQPGPGKALMTASHLPVSRACTASAPLLKRAMWSSPKSPVA